MVNVGKYISPMDPMGIIVIIMEKLGSLTHFSIIYSTGRGCSHIKTGWWLNQPF